MQFVKTTKAETCWVCRETIPAGVTAQTDGKGNWAHNGKCPSEIRAEQEIEAFGAGFPPKK